MTTDQYTDYRNQLYDFVRRDLEGPYEINEVIDEAPTQKYSTGILFAQASRQEREDDDASLDLRTRDDDDVNAIDMSSSFFPSAMGISFALNSSASRVKVKLDFGLYSRLTAKDYDKVRVFAPNFREKIESNTSFKEQFEISEDGYVSLKHPLDTHDRDILLSFANDDKLISNVIWSAYKLYKNGWYREQKSYDLDLDLVQGYLEHKVPDSKVSLGLTVKDMGTANKKRICTLSVINSKLVGKPQSEPDSALFQTHIEVDLLDGNDEFKNISQSDVDPDIFDDMEEKSLSLLYHNKEVFAVGHGISADWDRTNGKIENVHSDTLPSFSVPQMEFTLPPNGKQEPNLSMSGFAFGEDEEIFRNLELLSGAYSQWIDAIENELRTLPSSYHEIGSSHIEKCSLANQRIIKGIGLLKDNENVLKAFRHANEAMLMQRTHTRLQSDKKHYDTATPMPTNYQSEEDSWRPFQIAFLVMNLEAMANSDSTERDLVDLIWFPTGGGKTEAYLALTAYTIFLRRLLHKEGYGGTTVIMRYTLRLLTSQQFQRACTLICACESLRRRYEIYGEEEISVGLWLGSASTPNNLTDASYKIGALQKNPLNAENPFQVLNCPWCGTHMTKINGKGLFCYALKSRPKRFYMWCPNPECTFSDPNGGLPIRIIDEDIYNQPPTLLFGTVDKFAMLPWKKEASAIFGLGHHKQNLSPSLIIQDELHLISGSLGTMVGIYETAIDLLCSTKGVKPKIVASTATIRKAQEQCMALYSRKVAQFPSPGIDASDSFFARESEISSKTPGRFYIGVMPSGKTSTTMQVRLMADTIQGVEFVDGAEEVKDAYWTQVIYCNSIRELGSSKSVIYDDVKEYSQNLARYNHKKQRYYSDHNVQELTSRISAESIPEILSQLEISYPEKNAYDVLLATNMISVGVDIDRLGLMIILGQPKTTSEYIQASSRVGRKYPGIVFTLYSPVKSRDRSHYEQFKKYHQSLYRHVEPTSVTPFSAPVRDKALHALLITLIRHRLGLIDDSDLKSLDTRSQQYLAVVKEILDRVERIDPTELNDTRIEIDEITQRLNELIKNANVTYSTTKDKSKVALMKPVQETKDRGQYKTPQSMRSTDAECYITLDYS